MTTVERDRFVSDLYHSRINFGERAKLLGSPAKPIECCMIDLPRAWALKRGGGPWGGEIENGEI